MSKKPIRGHSLVTHPNRKWYDEQILKGLSITQIHNMQANHVPPELSVSTRTISEYRKNILRPNSEIVRQYQEELQKKEVEDIHSEIMKEDHVKEIVQKKSLEMIDTDDAFVTMYINLTNQIEKIAKIDDPKTRAKLDAATVVGDLCDKMRLLVMDVAKYRGQLRDSPQTQINIVNIEQKNAEMEAVRDAVLDTLQKIDPSLIPVFYDFLKTRMMPVVQTFEMKQKAIQQASSITEGDARSIVKAFTGSKIDIDEEF